MGCGPVEAQQYAKILPPLKIKNKERETKTVC
jgi:hypothetical protein